jgi:tRNA(Ile)-lysidine synthase
MRLEKEERNVPGRGRPMNAGRKEGTVPFSVEQSLARLLPGWPEARLCVALSGGVDSVTLLAVCADLGASHAALRLRAVHVHHGLLPEAEGWLAHCEDLCRRLAVPLEVVRLGLEPRLGASVEAEAREARYEALAARLAPGEALLTAHHEDDQLETVLLQLMRGAGVAGLAAMPASAALGRGVHLRPLLGVAREALETEARSRGLDWVDDPMNSGLRFDRTFLRSQVTPALRQRWPAAGRAVARSARHLAEAQGLLDELAAMDAASVADGECLSVAPLADLARPRQANLVRWWLRSRGLGMPSTARLDSILDDVLTAAPDRLPVVTWPSGEVRRYRGQLHAMPPLGPAPPGTWECAIGIGETVNLPAGRGEVSLVRSAGAGLAAEAVAGARVRFRRGGERLRPVAAAPRRGLAALFQLAGIPPWERCRLPVLAAGERALAVGERWIDQDAAVPSAGLRFEWRR